MNKIQSLRSSGMISLFGLILAVGLLVFWPWRLDSKSAEVEAAQKKAEILAYQIVQIYREAQIDVKPANPVQSRGLASVKEAPAVPAGGILREFKNQGVMGIDPWGHPYQYRIVQTESESRLMVWSLGPNGVLDNQDFLSDQAYEALNPVKAGDDIRVMLGVTAANASE